MDKTLFPLISFEITVKVKKKKKNWNVEIFLYYLQMQISACTFYKYVLAERIQICIF